MPHHHSSVSRVKHFRTVPMPGRKLGMTNHQASKTQFSKEPTPPSPMSQPGGGTWKLKSTSSDHRGNKSKQVFHISGQSKPRCAHITPHPNTAVMQNWKCLPHGLHGPGGYEARGMVITMNLHRSFLFGWLHPAHMLFASSIFLLLS